MSRGWKSVSIGGLLQTSRTTKRAMAPDVMGSSSCLQLLWKISFLLHSCPCQVKLHLVGLNGLMDKVIEQVALDHGFHKLQELNLLHCHQMTKMSIYLDHVLSFEECLDVLLFAIEE